jgi:hypothetical protein
MSKPRANKFSACGFKECFAKKLGRARGFFGSPTGEGSRRFKSPLSTNESVRTAVFPFGSNMKAEGSERLSGQLTVRDD